MKQSTCVYLIQHGRWLMLYRNKKKNDVNAGKYIGIGGKMEAGETPLQCAMREVKEETGLEMKNPVLRGKVRFVYPHLSDEMIWVYTCTDYSGKLHEDNEGTLAWINENEIMKLNLWEGDRLFLARLLKDDTAMFSYRLYYDENDKLLHAEEGKADLS